MSLADFNQNILKTTRGKSLCLHFYKSTKNYNSQSPTPSHLASLKGSKHLLQIPKEVNSVGFISWKVNRFTNVPYRSEQSFLLTVTVVLSITWFTDRKLIDFLVVTFSKIKLFFWGFLVNVDITDEIKSMYDHEKYAWRMRWLFSRLVWELGASVFCWFCLIEV